ncbi:unnamed protein product [Closterium sp. NIES-54]
MGASEPASASPGVAGNVSGRTCGADTSMGTNVATTVETNLETSLCETAGGAGGSDLRRTADRRIPAEREAAGVGLGAVLRGAAGVTAGALVMPSVVHALRAELVPRAGGAVAASADGIALQIFSVSCFLPQLPCSRPRHHHLRHHAPLLSTSPSPSPPLPSPSAPPLPPFRPNSAPPLRSTGVAVAPAARPDADSPHIRRPAASAAAAVSSARTPAAATAAPAELQEGDERGAGGATVMGLQQAQQGLRGDGLLGEGLRGEGLRGEGLRGEGLRGEGLGHGHGPEEDGLEDEEEIAAAAAAAAYAKRMRRAGQISTVGQLVAGGIAGAVSKTCTAPLARLTILFQVRDSNGATFPLDLVRRRMQLEGAGGRQPSQRRTIPQMLAHVVRTEGWQALYRGIVPEYAKVVPGVSIAFMTYEFMKRLLRPRDSFLD